MQEKEILHYNDGNIIISCDIYETEVSHTSRNKMLYVILCTGGKACIDINARTYNIGKDDILFLLPQSIVSNIVTDDDFISLTLGVKMTYLNKVLHSSASIWSTIHSLYNNPVMKINEDRMDIRDRYLSLIHEKLKHKDQTYYAEILNSLIQAILYETFSDILNNIVVPKDEYIRQGDILFKKFMGLLNQNGGKDRSVAYYADKLFVTPKHLSSVCKNITGKNALELIFRHVEDIIRYELKHTDKSIKEISEEMNFSNISFFGKFVKSRLGASPTDLRRLK